MRGNLDSLIVLVCEGEETGNAVLSVVGESYTVLTWRGGGGSAEQADVSAVADRMVMLWPDDDDVGHHAMSVVAGKCWAAGATEVRILPGIGGPKGDAADINSHTVQPHIDGGGKLDPRGPISILTVEPIPPRFLVDPLILCDDINFLSGPGGASKTRLALSLLGALPKGGHILGHPDLDVPALGRGCLITGGEERIATLRWMDPAADCDVLTADEPWTDRDGQLTYVAEWHLTMCIRRGYPLVVLDSVSNLFHGNENDRYHVNQFISALRTYAYQGLSILLIGHTSRQNNVWSGSTGWQSGPRSHVSISKDEKDPDITIVGLQKANRARAGQLWRVTNVDDAGHFVPWRMADDELNEVGEGGDAEGRRASAAGDGAGPRRAA